MLTPDYAFSHPIGAASLFGPQYSHHVLNSLSLNTDQVSHQHTLSSLRLWSGDEKIKDCHLQWDCNNEYIYKLLLLTVTPSPRTLREHKTKH